MNPPAEPPPTIAIRRKFHIGTGRTGHRVVRDTAPPAPAPGHSSAGHIPRLSRLMALALRFEQLIREGTVHNQANLARLAHISRARVTQIMDLLLLAPEIQAEILFLPPLERGKDLITERCLRRIISKLDWDQQRSAWSSPSIKTSAKGRMDSNPMKMAGSPRGPEPKGVERHRGSR